MDGDVFCRGCQYNLRGQPIRREPCTGLVLVRCPECGAFSPAEAGLSASQRWLHRLAGPAMVAWVLLLIGGLAASGLALFIDMVVMWEWVEYFDRRHQYSHRYRNGEFSMEDLIGFSMMAGAALALGGLTTLAGSVCLPHWKRWGVLLASVAWPAATYGIMAMITMFDHYDRAPYKDWSITQALLMSTGALAMVAVLSGVLMSFIGRPVARGVVRLLLPRKLRGPLAYLWLVDEKTPPIG